MTAMIQTLRCAPPTTLLLSLWSALSAVLCRLEAGLLAQRDYARLDAMSDGELARRGLTREEVPAAVMRAMLGRCPR